MSTFLKRFSSVSDFLYLPRLIPTVRDIILQPKQFFNHYLHIVEKRSVSFFDIHFEKHDDRYLGPAKFAALVIGFSNLALMPLLYLSVAVGTASQETLDFAKWAKQQGYLDQFNWTGIFFFDDVIQDLVRLLTMYTLGVLVWAFSAKAIPIRFSSGYFFYLNAWSLLDLLLTICFTMLSILIPFYQTGIPQAISTIISFIYIYMIIVFPILYWPEILNISRQKVAIALIGALVSWIALIALLAPFIIKMPEF